MIFRRRRPMLIGSAVLVLIAAVFALPVFGELGFGVAMALLIDATIVRALLVPA